MNRLATIVAVAVAVSSAGALSASAVAASAKVRDLQILTSVTTRAPNQLPGAPLAVGATYRASVFPLEIRFRAPGTGWVGAQGRTLPPTPQSTKPGAFGWVELEHRLGAASLATGYGPTPSVAAVASGLRTRGRGATYEPSSAVRLAGFAGTRFDGTVTGPTHLFVPFTPPSGSARFLPDSYEVTQGEAFRIVVLAVHGKTVFILLHADAADFDTFAAQADRLFATLTFRRAA